MKVMMIVSYDGSKFHGFQRQNNERNVQGYLENVLSNILKENIVIKGSGRTDKGVHAMYQVIHFETNMSIKGLKRLLNNKLYDINVKKIKKVDDSFHARHSVKNKTYLYKIDLKGNKDNNYYLYVKNKLNIKKMRDASKYLVGTHNFHNFVAGHREDYTSTIINIRIYKRFNTLYLKFKGVGFYRYMVRNLVGALLEVGKGKIDKSVIKEMILTDKEKRLPTSSPNGLYLYKINY